MQPYISRLERQVFWETHISGNLILSGGSVVERDKTRGFRHEQLDLVDAIGISESLNMDPGIRSEQPVSRSIFLGRDSVYILVGTSANAYGRKIPARIAEQRIRIFIDPRPTTPLIPCPCSIESCSLRSGPTPLASRTSCRRVTSAPQRPARLSVGCRLYLIADSSKYSSRITRSRYG